MEKPDNVNNADDDNAANAANDNNFKVFATKRVMVGVLLTVVALWVVGSVISLFEKPKTKQAARSTGIEQQQGDETEDGTEPETQPAPATPRLEEGAAIDYPVGSAGAIMRRDFVALGQDTPVDAVLKILKKQHRNVRQPFHLYVVDAQNRLLGMVSLKQLMFANSKNRLQDIMTRNVNSVSTMTSETKAANMIARYNMLALPVTNDQQKLVGVIKADDVVDLTRKELEAHQPQAAPAEVAEAEAPKVRGVAFIEAMIEPLDHELHQRFWGWRPNDILNFTDNVNNYQLGVLEVTRRTAVILTERLSRTGTTASIDLNLERAMNWFMIKAERYWFPSPEGKYSAGIKELKAYMQKLQNRSANFYTRADNLIPLLSAYEDLLGSCDENLVKSKEDDGTPVSFFKSDDYFFYAQGVASAMYTILEAVLKDFHGTVDSRRGLEVLHHAIESCQRAMKISPLVVTNSKLDGVLANHRANMAAPISHARFYLGLLIKTLST